MRTISIAPKKSQSISVSLGGQQCQIRLVQRSSFMYMDLTADDRVIMQGVPCLFGNRMVGYGYLGFVGDLIFIDNVGQENPNWEGLGTRFTLYYAEKADLV